MLDERLMISHVLTRRTTRFIFALKAALAPSKSRVGALTQEEMFSYKQKKLRLLCEEFGYDPSLVILSDAPYSFNYLNQNFTSEGQAYPDGRIEIYFDPDMTDARMACCLAHELQHQKYFLVRTAYQAESIHGPLHQRFAPFTSETLAALGGVSDYSREHWQAWQGRSLPVLFSDELADGQCEPINETLAEIAKAEYNWGSIAWIDSIWRQLYLAINNEYRRLSSQKRDSL